jgi:hypothetical protein
MIKQIRLTWVKTTGGIRDQFHFCIRFWRLFRMMEMQGCKTYSELMNKGIVDLCPACPHPGVNIPDNWASHQHK